MLETTKRMGWFLGIAIGGTMIACSANCAIAQITPDSTLPNNSLVTPSGNTTIIEGGTQAGKNLFHSFQQFSVSMDSTAFFNNALDIQNIISRVTGRSISNIDGLIRTNGSANLFLLNPNGIVFGQNASLNIGGSFIATTANAIQFGNQGFFSATNPETPSPLLTVNPSAFFVNQLQPGRIETLSSHLKVPNGRSLLLVGGDIAVTGGVLNARSGRVELAGVAGTGLVGLNLDAQALSLSVPDNLRQANISLANDAQVRVIGEGTGSIAVNALNLELKNNSMFLAGIDSGLGTSNTQARDIEINAKNRVSLDRSAIYNDLQNRARGQGGNLKITGNSLSLTNGAEVAASTFGQGTAGSVNINTKDTVSIDGPSGVFSTVEKEGQGNGGNISITTDSLSLTNGAQLSTSTSGLGNAGDVIINANKNVSFDGEYSDGLRSATFSQVRNNAVGRGGNIEITTGSLAVTNGALLATDTNGKGDGGNIIIHATNSVSFDGASKNGFSSRVSSLVRDNAVGDGGTIEITTGSLSITNNAQIATSTLGKGNAGNVIVVAKDAISLAYAAILSGVNAGGVGKGGNININAATLSLTTGAQLLTITRGATATQPAGQGDAGNVNIKVAGKVDIVGEKNGFLSKIGSEVDTGTVGNGGNITIDSGSFSLRDGTQLATSTSGKGNAGNIRINTKDTVIISGTSQESGFSSALLTFTDSNSTGKGGDITVNTNKFRISDGALLDARTINNAKGGNITVNASVFEATSGGQLSTISELGKGHAGKITVNATDKVIVSGSDPNFSDRSARFPNRFKDLSANSGLFVSSTGSGTTGDIEINSPKITLDNQGTLNADSASGNGGNINLNSDLLLLRRHSQISTNAGTEQQGGDGGNIDIDSKFIVAVPNENSDITANAFNGYGGKIQINATNIFGIAPLSRQDLERLRPLDLDPLQLPSNDITAVSQENPSLSGTIQINTPDADPSRGLAELPTNVIDVSGQIANGCTPGSRQSQSSFIATGRGGLPISPNQPLQDVSMLSNWVRVAEKPATSNQVKPTPLLAKSATQIVEAQGWMVDANGGVVLVAQAPQANPRSSWQAPVSCPAL